MANATSSYLNRSTPGVYISEIDAFGSSIVGVATAVPTFIGYTQFAGDPNTGRALYNTPVSITSMGDFLTYFGGAAERTYTVRPVPQPTPPTGAAPPSTTAAPIVAPAPSFVADYTEETTDPTGLAVASTGFMLAPASNETPFNLYWQMRLFFANGGGNCYVVSVGSYWAAQYPARLSDPVPADWLPGTIATGDPATSGESGLLTGLVAAGYAAGPTMIVIPEACQLDQADYATVAAAMLDQAGSLQDRVAILDLPGCMTATTYAELQKCQDNLTNAIAPQAANRSYGAAYAPALNATVVTTADLMFTNLLAPQDGGNSIVNNILTTQAAQLYKDAQLASVQSAIAAGFPLGPTFGTANTAQYSVDASAYPAPPPGPALPQWQRSLDTFLLNSLPVFKQIEQLIANDMNIAPPSGAIAGIWPQNDMTRGVWNAPANIALTSVASPLYNMNETEQASFNVPLNGEAINVLRSFVNRGTVVWGARTLDGNSFDYRYIQVRRTLIYIEQSIKNALQSYVFAANDATTWATVTASISSFLTGLWQQGGLMGAKASDAYTVSCGLGSTMTPQDILDGYMNVSVMLQMIHPAEFIQLTFRQNMSG